MRTRRLRSTVAVLLIVFTVVLASTPGRVLGLYQGGSGEGTRWPGTLAKTAVRVCFRSPGTIDKDQQGNTYTVNYPENEWLIKQALVRDALEDSWGRWTNLTFTGWGTCGRDVSGYLYVDLIKEDCGGCGDSIPRGYDPNGVRVWLKMENPDDRLLRSVAIHEIGHSLGFHHEMDRPDAAFPAGTTPCDRVVYTAGTYLTPYYDDVSIMNYCAPRNRNGLSAGDREGSEVLYGTSPAGVWVKTLPAQPVFLDPTFVLNVPYVSR